MDHSRRRDDPEDEDHSEERTIDWRQVAPRWFLILALVASVGLNAMLGSVVRGLIEERFAQIERDNNDPKWTLLSKHAQILAEQGAVLRQHEIMIRDAYDLRVKMIEMQSDLKDMRRVLEAQKRRSSGM